MKRLFIAGVAGLLASCTTTQPTGEPVPVTTISGTWIHIRNVVALRTADQTIVRGDATRTPSRQGPIIEHLHVDAMDSAGVVVLTKDAPWNTSLSLRTRNMATFRAEFDHGETPRIASIRVSLVNGAHH